jgi:hypothetical protein
MALLKCPDCGHQIFTRAETCPSCGCPLDSRDFAAPLPGNVHLYVSFRGDLQEFGDERSQVTFKFTTSPQVKFDGQTIPVSGSLYGGLSFSVQTVMGKHRLELDWQRVKVYLYGNGPACRFDNRAELDFDLDQQGEIHLELGYRYPHFFVISLEKR